jgi:hypothetical protein
MSTLFRQGDKTWFREFADQNGITFKKLRTEIFPHMPPKTLEHLWQKRHAANGGLADALYWYAKAKRKKWDCAEENSQREASPNTQ